MCKLGVLFTNYGPYHIARIKALHSCLKKRNWQVVGIELAREEVEYAWKASVEGLTFTVVSVIQDQQLENVKFSQLLQQLYAVLSEVKPDVLVVAGYARPAMLAALLWSLWKQKPAVLLSETKQDDAPRYWWSETIKRWLLQWYKAAVVGGQPHRRYLIELGIPADTIFLGYDVVDNNFYHPNKIRSLPVDLHNSYFLAINRFVRKKNLLLLISAYAAYRQAAGFNAWNLVLCGDGQLRPQIEKQITDLALLNSVHLPGFLQQDELLPYFAHAKYFVHASTQEQWGLVVNEAMAASLPVLVSNRCGCFEDLIIEGVNGFGFDPENPQQLADLMLKMSSGEVNLKAMGEASLEHIQKFSPDYFAQGLIQAVECALAHR